jgi:hypothetical protein
MPAAARRTPAAARSRRIRSPGRMSNPVTNRTVPIASRLRSSVSNESTPPEKKDAAPRGSPSGAGRPAGAALTAMGRYSRFQEWNSAWIRDRLASRRGDTGASDRTAQPRAMAGSRTAGSRADASASGRAPRTSQYRSNDPCGVRSAAVTRPPSPCGARRGVPIVRVPTGAG